MDITCISDTHNMLDQVILPETSVLIHAGDACGRGTDIELADFNAELGELVDLYGIERVVFIPGNHDMICQDKAASQAILTNVTDYLIDEAVVINGVKIYGSPWQPEFHDWAFNLPRGPALAHIWSKIPDDTDILVTHGPPKGHGGWVIRDGEDAGCEDLLKRIEVVKPKYHIFGHIHEGYGITKNDHTTFVNASICNHKYRPINKPIVISI